MKDDIPKRIIHIWGQGEHALSLISKASITNAKLIHPEFEFVFFDNNSMDAFTEKHFPEYRILLQSFRLPIQRYDFFRYLAIYRLGGFYLDLDVFLASALDGLLKANCVFTFEELTLNKFLRRRYGIDWEIANYAFGAAPGHPFIGAIIENCIRAHDDPKWVNPMMKPIPLMFREAFYAFYTSGPGLVTRTLVENREMARQILILFPENVCDFANWHHFGEFGVHLQQGTWLNRKGAFRRKSLRLWISWMRRRLLQESMMLGPKRAWNATQDDDLPRSS
jgi:hypothetical protein